jgi:hypothetical protein
VLTHAGAGPGWQGSPWHGVAVVATYDAPVAAPLDTPALAAATHVYWSSVAQFDAGRAHASPAAHHASGAGKTAEHIRRAGIARFTAFPSVNEWQQWTARAR